MNNPASTWNAGALSALPGAGAHIGGTWRLVIHDVSGQDIGSITGWSIAGSLSGPPIGTPCEIAPPISVGMTWTATMGNAEVDSAPGCGQPSKARWFKLVPDRDQDVNISLCGAAFDTMLGVYAGGCDALRLVACNDDSCGAQSELTFAAAKGQTYLIRVGAVADQTGSFTINLTTPPVSDCPKAGSCPADLDGSGAVGGVDLGLLLAAWSIPADQPGCGGAKSCCADFSGDGLVNGVDLGILLSNWEGQGGGDPACR